VVLVVLVALVVVLVALVVMMVVVTAVGIAIESQLVRKCIGDSDGEMGNVEVGRSAWVSVQSGSVLAADWYK